MIPDVWIDQAVERIGRYLQPTPLTYDPVRNIYLKWDNRQITGSFKLRGALNKVLSLVDWELERGLVTASAGNHGQGLAWAARQVGAAVTVFASEHAVHAKVEAMRALGAQVKFVQGGYADAEQAGKEFARDTEATWISPYNDGQVIAGQASLAVESLRQLQGQPVAVWVVPVGGGGLLAGVGSALNTQADRPALIGVQSQASAYFEALFHRGSQAGVVETDSLADGLAGAVEEGSLTIPMVKKLADDIRLVSEQEIAEAINYAWHEYHEKIEGSAAAALAAVLNHIVTDRPALVVISGGNIQPELHDRLCRQYTPQIGGLL